MIERNNEEMNPLEKLIFEELNKESMNPAFQEAFREVLKDPTLLDGVNNIELDDDNSDVMFDLVAETFNHFTDTMLLINNIIETSPDYENMKDAISNIMANFSDEWAWFIEEFATNWFESSEGIDEIKAKATFRKYNAYIKAGFTSDQAFKLINQNKEETKNSFDTATIMNLIKEINTKPPKK